MSAEIHQLQAQLKAADELAAAFKVLCGATGEAEWPWRQAKFRLEAYLRLREPQAPVKFVSRCPECKYEQAIDDHEVGCYEGSRVEGVRWRDMPEPAQPAIPQGEGARCHSVVEDELVPQKITRRSCLKLQPCPDHAGAQEPATCQAPDECEFFGRCGAPAISGTTRCLQHPKEKL